MLLLDAGNTSLKLGLRGPDGELRDYSLPSTPEATADSLGLSIISAISHAGFDPEDMPAWVACSVVPRLDRLLREAAMRYCGCEALFVPGEIPLPLANRYQRPEEVGADRLVTAYAASRTVDAPGCLVIDFGTATTFDLVAGGEYLGGLICPGVLTSARALSSGTAKLPQAELRVETDQAEPGLSTATSLSHGLVFGFAAMAEGLAARLLPRLPEGSAVVATGGLAPHIARVCRAIHLVRPHLLLEGLELAYTDNSLFQPAKGA